MPVRPQGLKAAKTIHIEKAFLYALVLTIEELRKLSQVIKSKATGAPQKVYCMPTFFFFRLTAGLGKGRSYIYISVGLSVARFDDLGNAKAFLLWNERQNGSTFFCVYYNDRLS